MSATMNPGVLPDTWDVRCDEHHLDQRGLSQAHAQNLVRKHDRDAHQGPVYPAAAARVVLAAWGDLDEARRETDPDKFWVRQKAAEAYHLTLDVWKALTGVWEDGEALEAARRFAHLPTDAQAHTAPF